MVFIFSDVNKMVEEKSYAAVANVFFIISPFLDRILCFEHNPVFSSFHRLNSNISNLQLFRKPEREKKCTGEFVTREIFDG